MTTVNASASISAQRTLRQGHAAHPAHGIKASGGNVVRTEGYTIRVTQGTVEIRDRKGTSIKVSGDMQIATKDKDNVRVENGNVTFNLKDGTKVTLIPTEDGKKIARVVITKDNSAVTLSNVDSNPKSSGVRVGRASKADASTPDGFSFQAGNQVDDLFVDGKGEIIGTNVFQRNEAMPLVSENPGQQPPQVAPGTPGNVPPDTKANGEISATQSTKSLLDLFQQTDDKIKALEKDLSNKDLTPGQLQTISSQMSRLQNMQMMISNMLKSKSDTEAAIIRNFR